MMPFEQTVMEMKQVNTFFESNKPVFISRAPGRLDLMGGNDDYTGGLVFESTIREATFAAAQLRNDKLVILYNKAIDGTGWQTEISTSLDCLKDEQQVKKYVNSSPSVRWTAYVLGNIHYLLKHFPEKLTTGLSIYMDSTVPLNRGVSSSAAIEVAVMKSCVAACDIQLEGIELALACQWVENVIAGSGCGIMDQAAVVLGKQGYVLPLICQPCIPQILVKLPEELKVWGIDSGVSHQVSGIEYEAARAAAFMGYKMICDLEKLDVKEEIQAGIPRFTDPLWNGYLARISPFEFYSRYSNALPETISKDDYLSHHQLHVDPMSELRDEVQYKVFANTKYAIEENHRVQLFASLSAGAAVVPSKDSFKLMGELMYQSHHAYTECGLGSKATDTLVELFHKAGPSNGIYGAKITGGGAGGTVAILADKNAGDKVAELFECYKEMNFGDPYLFEGSSDGADTYGIRVIP